MGSASRTGDKGSSTGSGCSFLHLAHFPPFPVVCPPDRFGATPRAFLAVLAPVMGTCAGLVTVCAPFAVLAPVVALVTGLVALRAFAGLPVVAVVTGLAALGAFAA